MLDIRDKLSEVYESYLRMERELSRPESTSDMKKYTKMMKEYKHLKKVSDKFLEWTKLEHEMSGHRQMLASEKDPDLVEMIRSELPDLESEYDRLYEELNVLLIPRDPLDEKNAILEIRAGTGGDEAALFAGEVYRMYCRYAEMNRWKVEVMSMSSMEGGGIKEVISIVTGEDVYGRLKYEGGVHRVQRVPVTESQGRVHTSAITVAVLPEVDEIDEVTIDEKDLKIDIYRASGAGGQHVNKTDSAVRITHLPTGIVVAMQDERSQIQNRVKAMKIIESKVLQMEREKAEKEISSKRKSLVGSGDRSEKIRTYNFPQGRVTDHRIKLTLYRINDIMEGSLDMLIDPLVNYQNALLLGRSVEEFGNDSDDQ
ncbi:MAG TPA: peptide chain release factor 1 [bacterium]|jgi:peptide chain release factor 1|nr:peptide chain release factor 1 [bacterium]HNZ54010.1 peptide chain release factor 1 [bacterium]HOG43269.1 peptide chain release factor 1 [bacterium]HPG35630.1 peptide chain release factor 1 [bacterium]HPY15520.1 peptide chain release factor 1 [bacterium]